VEAAADRSLACAVPFSWALVGFEDIIAGAAIKNGIPECCKK